MLTNQLKEDLLQIEAETFEILDLTETAQDLANLPTDALTKIDEMAAACSSSCSCSSCCSCSTSSCCSTSSSTSSCG